MEYDRIELFNKYIIIKKDLMENLEEVYYRQNYYNRKYRGNILLDVNVTVGDSPETNNKRIQIFLRFKKYYIKEIIEYNSKGLYKSDIKSNLHGE